MRNRISRLWLVNKHDCEHNSTYIKKCFKEKSGCRSQGIKHRKCSISDLGAHQVTRCSLAEESQCVQCHEQQHRCCSCLKAGKSNKLRTIVHVLFIKSCYNQILEILLVLFLVICLTNSFIRMPSSFVQATTSASSSRERINRDFTNLNYGIFSIYNNVESEQEDSHRDRQLSYSQLEKNNRHLRESHSIGGSAFGYNGVQIHHNLEDFGSSNNLSRSQNFKINPKPCSIGLLEGTCMFVWECIKSEGRHMGMCVDSFMFGSCCAHNYTENIILPNSFSYTRPTKPSSLANLYYRPPVQIHRPIISGMTTIERPHGAGTLVIRPSGPHHQSYLSKPLQIKPSHSSLSPIVSSSHHNLSSNDVTPSDYSILNWIHNNTIHGNTHANIGVYQQQYWHLTTEPNFITKTRPPNWDKPIILRPKPSKPTKKPINSTILFYTSQYETPNGYYHIRPPVNTSEVAYSHSNISHFTSGKPMKPIAVKPISTILSTSVIASMDNISSTLAANGESIASMMTTIKTEPAIIDEHNGNLLNNQQQHSHYQQNLHYQPHGSSVSTWPSYNSKPTSTFFITSSSDFVGKPITTSAAAIVSSSVANPNYGSSVNAVTESEPTIDVMTTMVLESSSSSTTILNTKMPLPLTTMVSFTSHTPSINIHSSLRPVQFVDPLVTATTDSTSVITNSNMVVTTTESLTTCSNSTEILPIHLLSTLESNEIADNSDKLPGGNVIKTVSAARTECGTPILTRPETRIVGGKSAVFGRWPWQVSVRRTSFFGFSSTHRCGGALLNENWIATAGHCVDDLLISQIRIRVGEYDFSHVQEQLPYIEKGVLKKIVHPQYNFFTYEYDLALVKLEQSLEFAPHVSPICLPQTESLLIGMNATVTGWGRLSEGGTLPSVLQEVSVPIVSNDNCKSMFLRAGRQEFIPEIFLCAGYETGGQDSCQGDSGGPLQVKSQDGRYFLAGIISWGIGCAEANLPGVCTRISKFVPWIMMNVT